MNQNRETDVMVKTIPLAKKLAYALISLLAMFSMFGGIVAFNASQDQEQKLLQSLSRDLAQNIVDNWPNVTAANVSEGRIAERNAILSMLMVVNPTIQVYVLDEGGKVLAFINTAQELQTQIVDLKPIEHFLQNAMFPIRGTDPLNTDVPRIFSAAKFTPPSSYWPAHSESNKRGYLYILINSQMQKNGHSVSGIAKNFGGSLTLLILAFMATSILGYLIVKKFTRRLEILATKIASFQIDRNELKPLENTTPLQGNDEVAILEKSFASMTARFDLQSSVAARVSHDHREVMAGVAHDLRAPLTALHGNLESLDQRSLSISIEDRNVLRVAIEQSDRVRALSQELFELAALELTDQIIEFEWFSLDDLVGDIVQKFTQFESNITFTYSQIPPKPIKIKANIHLIERAITNLIDNATKHAKSMKTLKIDVEINTMSEDFVRVAIGDNGTGFSTDIIERLSLGRSLRSPPLKRTTSCIGGLGLAISQRIAKLHGGNLSACNRPNEGGQIRLNLKRHLN